MAHFHRNSGSLWSGISTELTDERNEITNEKVFALTGLLFEEDLEISFSEESETIRIKTTTSNLNVPILIVKQNGLSK